MFREDLCGRFLRSVCGDSLAAPEEALAVSPPQQEPRAKLTYGNTNSP